MEPSVGKEQKFKNFDFEYTDIQEGKSRNRRNIGRTLKLVIFLFCLIGFGYQVVEFCTYFLTYPTVTNIEVDEIDSFILPALTFCNINPVQRSKYCEKYPTRCERKIPFSEDRKEFCAQYPFYCKDPISDLRIPLEQYQEDLPSPDYRLTEEDIIELGQNDIDFDVSHKLANENSSASSNFTRVYFTNAQKDFYLCYTTNARYTNTPDLPPQKFNEEEYPTNIAFFLLSVQPEESFSKQKKHGLRFLIHSPYFTMNPFIKGLLMKPGNAYKIHISLVLRNAQEVKLLPFPYKTDCMDYEELWLKSDRMGPRSQQMCKNNCQRVFNKACYGCEKNLTVFLATDKVCKLHDDIICNSTESEEELIGNLKSCLKLCKKDCRKLVYQYTVEEIPETHLEEENLIIAAISVDEPEVMILTHNPQYQKVELFSYIGGFMGCWLGLSIWAFASYLGRTLRPMKKGIESIHRRISSKQLHNIYM